MLAPHESALAPLLLLQTEVSERGDLASGLKVHATDRKEVEKGTVLQIRPTGACARP